MAHLIDDTKGFDGFISYLKPAWHGLGKIFVDEITIETALKESGMDYEVFKAPNIHRFLDGTEVPSKNSFFTYRKDVIPNIVLGHHVGPDYMVLQNHEALSVAQELLQSGSFKVETAGVLDQGRRVFICLSFNKSLMIGGKKDRVNEYLLIATSHDGSLAITAQLTSVRVVCQNTLSLAIGSAKKSSTIKIRHTQSAKERLSEAARIITSLEENHEINHKNFEKMHSAKVDNDFVKRYIIGSIATKEQLKEMEKNKLSYEEVLPNGKLNIISEIYNTSLHGIGQIEALNNGSPNLWYAYNAITNYYSHKEYKNAEARTSSLLFGDSASKIETAGNLALVMADEILK